MGDQVLMLLESLMLAVALSTDAFVASFAYGTNKIHIPLSSVAVINVICSVMLAISLFLGSLLRPFLPGHLTGIICFCILFILGIVRLCDSTIKAFIRRHSKLHKQFAFSALHLSFILYVYADPEQADSDQSKILSPAEAASLALAVSLDSLAVGFGSALSNINWLQTITATFLCGLFAVFMGCFIGNKIAEKLSLDLSWLSGLLLMVLAVMKL